jgi:hypothetical protein
MTFRITDTVAGTQQIADISTTQNHPLGTIVRAKDPTYGEGEFIYLLGVTGTTAGIFVTYSVGLGHQTKLGLSIVSTSEPIAVAMSANVGSSYGWYQISGLAIGSTAGAASFAAGAAFAVSAGEMIVADTTDRLGGAIVAVANPSTTTLLVVNVMIDRPTSSGGEA